MKAIRRFLSPSDARPAPEIKPPRRSMSMRFRSPSSRSRTLSQHSEQPSVQSVQSASTNVSQSRKSSGLTSGATSIANSVVSSSYSSIARTASTTRGPVRGRRARNGTPLHVIDAEDYPRVIATLMANAPRAALLKLRLVSKSFRDMADAQLARHLILSAPPGVSSLRVTSPPEVGPAPGTHIALSLSVPSSGGSRANTGAGAGGNETGIPGLSVRVLWNRDERRRLTRILTGTRVIDLRGPARARDSEIADLTLQCGCARTVRMRPDASGTPPTSCPLPPRVTQLIAFTSLAADGAGLSATEKVARRSSWLVTDREHLHLQPASTAYIGPVPNRIQHLVVTVRYPRSHELGPSPTSRIPARPLRPLAPWDHPASLRDVTVIFLPEESKRAKPRPRSFLGISPGAGAETTPIFEQHATLKANKRMSWRASGSSPVSATFTSSPARTPTSPAFSLGTLAPVDPSFPAVASPPFPPSAPLLMFSDADAEHAGDLSRLGYLTPFIRSVAAHLPRVTYNLVDASRIDPVLLGFAPGTLLSPRQIEMLINKALRAELAYTGWDREETDFLMGGLTYTNRQQYELAVGAAEYQLQTVE